MSQTCIYFSFLRCTDVDYRECGVTIGARICMRLLLLRGEHVRIEGSLKHQQRASHHKRPSILQMRQPLI